MPNVRLFKPLSVLTTLCLLTVVALGQPSGIRWKCSIFANGYSTNRSIEGRWLTSTSEDRTIYASSYQNYTRGSRITYREYLINEYGSVESARTEFERYLVVAKNDELGTPSLARGIVDGMEYELDNLDSMVAASYAPGLPTFDLQQEQSNRYVACISAEDGSILSEADRRRY